MEAFLSILREFGFPIFVCVWFMGRLEKRLEKMSSRVQRLTVVNSVLVKALDADELEDGFEEGCAYCYENPPED